MSHPNVDALARRVVAALEPAPPLVVAAAEAFAENAARGPGDPITGIPTVQQRVRVKRGQADEFWVALADLYEAVVP